jgi:protein-S-isoprenylcysteine O-methyltransferase Ste14
MTGQDTTATARDQASGRASRLRAAAGTAAFLVLAPGAVVGVLPWLITGWRAAHWGPAAAAAGVLLIAAGCGSLLYAFGQFVLEGLGTPAPSAPTEQLVVRGLYRYVRNPMYLAVLAAVAGQALLLGRPVLFGYGAAVAVAVGCFVHWYEEPGLTRRYGDEYLGYRQQVRGWIPAWPWPCGHRAGRAGRG